MSKFYCTNESCKGRDSCVKALPMQDGDTPKYFFNQSDNNRCRDYECAHPVWRQYASFGFKECHACHHRESYHAQGHYEPSII